MRQKITILLFCFAILCSAAAQSSDPNVTAFSKFNIAGPQTFSFASNKIGEPLFGGGRVNFTAKVVPLDRNTVPKMYSGTCYTMRSYTFDNSEVPQPTGETTCTDSKLAQKKFTGTEQREVQLKR
ncbi:MAG: hypothetical protein JWN45_2630 [Acidobacteriaceae bacterium]|nr:hypothetical protein [Acidobacteriaceae bacterium]